MDTNIKYKNQLDLLLANSVTFLREFESGRFADMDKFIEQHNQDLVDLMHGMDLQNLTEKEQAILYMVQMNQNSAISLISRQKQQLAKKLGELRNGRDLKQTYNNCL